MSDGWTSSEWTQVPDTGGLSSPAPTGRYVVYVCRNESEDAAVGEEVPKLLLEEEEVGLVWSDALFLLS